MAEPKPELRLVNVDTAEGSDAFAALQLATPGGRIRRVDLTEGQALELASALLAIAAKGARDRARGGA